MVAQYAAAAGATTAVALVPSTPRGYELRDIFRAEFEAHGGTLLDFIGYDTNAQDFLRSDYDACSTSSRSMQRQRRLAANLGVPMQFEPRRRQDVDLIFLEADVAHGPSSHSAAPLQFAGRHSDLRDFRHLSARRHRALQRSEWRAVSRHAGRARAGSGRGRDPLRAAGLLAAAGRTGAFLRHGVRCVPARRRALRGRRLGLAAGTECRAISYVAADGRFTGRCRSDSFAMGDRSRSRSRCRNCARIGSSSAFE